MKTNCTITGNRYYIVLLLTLLSLGSTSVKAQTFTWFKDIDGDGWGNPNDSIISTTQPTGYVLNNLDCNDDVFHKTSWQTVGNPNFTSANTATCRYPRIKIDNNDVVYVASGRMSPTTGGSTDLRSFTNNNWPVVGNIFSQTRFGSNNVALDKNNTPYLLGVEQQGTGNPPPQSLMNWLRVKKLNNNNTWINVGNVVNDTSTTCADIKINDAGIIYVVYGDKRQNNKLSAKMYNGANWSYVGQPGFSLRSTISYRYDHISMDLDSKGRPYVAYIDSFNERRITVMMCDENNIWKLVGQEGFSYKNATSITIAIDNNDIPYVGYLQGDTKLGHRAVVMKYDGSTWGLVGGTVPDTARGIGGSVSLALGPTGTPYCGFERSGLSSNPNPSAAIIKKYDGNTWVMVAQDSFPQLFTNYSALAVNSMDIPYFAYQGEYTLGQHAITVMTIKPEIREPNIPALLAEPVTMEIGDTTKISVVGSALNDASYWQWYTDSCNGTQVIPITSSPDGSWITIAPTNTTTYYVRAEGDCIEEPGSCGKTTIVVNPVSINSISSTNDVFTLYPNPNKGSFNLSGNIDIHNKAELTVTNSIGQVIFSTTIEVNADNNFKHNLSIPGISAGVYVVTVQTESKEYRKIFTVTH